MRAVHDDTRLLFVTFSHLTSREDVRAHARAKNNTLAECDSREVSLSPGRDIVEAIKRRAEGSEPRIKA